MADEDSSGEQLVYAEWNREFSCTGTAIGVERSASNGASGLLCCPSASHFSVVAAAVSVTHNPTPPLHPARFTMITENTDRILRLNAVLDRTGLSRSVLYRKVDQETFLPRCASPHGALAGGGPRYWNGCAIPFSIAWWM